jgi:hypothetical protein
MTACGSSTMTEGDSNLLFKMEKFAETRYPKFANPLAEIMLNIFKSPHFITACEGWGPGPIGERICETYHFYQKEFTRIEVKDYQAMMTIAEQFYKNVEIPGTNKSWKW